MQVDKIKYSKKLNFSIVIIFIVKKIIESSILVNFNCLYNSKNNI